MTRVIIFLATIAIIDALFVVRGFQSTNKRRDNLADAQSPLSHSTPDSDGAQR